MEAYCVKCKKKVTVPDSEAVRVVTKNGRLMLKGKCPECGTNVNRFLSGQK